VVDDVIEPELRSEHLTIKLYIYITNKMICFHVHLCTLNKHQMQANLIIKKMK